ncbi:hypothetical protein WMY93_025840 [Mugilogobius chulae]|uniref:Uncharacterized protein n=1 Tax=Mugilogobius chulae TaxID=88201 RepID=A0AAW0MZA2_9GOBI
MDLNQMLSEIEGGNDEEIERLLQRYNSENNRTFTFDQKEESLRIYCKSQEYLAANLYQSPSPGTGHTMRGLLVQVNDRRDSWYKSRNEGTLGTSHVTTRGTPGSSHDTRGLLVQVTTREDSWYKSRTREDSWVQVTTREDSWYKSRHEGTPGASHDTMDSWYKSRDEGILVPSHVTRGLLVQVHGTRDSWYKSRDSWYKSRDEGTPGISHVDEGLLVQVTGRGDSCYKSRDEGTPGASHDTRDFLGTAWYRSHVNEGTPGTSHGRGDSWYKSRDEGTPGTSHGRGDSCYKSRDEGTPGASHDTRGLLVQVTGRGDSCYKSRDEGTPGYRDEPEWNQTLDENITGPWNETVEEPHESWAVPVPLTELMFGLRLVELAVLFLILVLLLRLYTVGFLCRPSDRQQEAEETQEAMEETLFPYYNRIHYTAYTKTYHTRNRPYQKQTTPTNRPQPITSTNDRTTTDRSYNRLHPQLSTFTIAYKHNRPHPTDRIHK